MKGSIKILDASGHTTVTYDTDDPNSMLNATSKLMQTSRFATLFDAATKEKVDRTVTDYTILEQHEELIVVPVMAGGRGNWRSSPSEGRRDSRAATALCAVAGSSTHRSGPSSGRRSCCGGS